MRGATGSWSVSSLTYNGTSLTQAAANESSGSSRNVRTEVWYMVNPPSGSSYTVSVTTSATMMCYVLSAMSLTGVDQTTPVGNTNTHAGNTAAYSASITTTVADAWLIGGAGIRKGTNSWSPDSGVSEIFEQGSGSSDTNDVTGTGLYRVCTSTGSYSIGSTASSSNFGVLAAIAVNPAVLDATIEMDVLTSTAALIALGVVPGALALLMDVLSGIVAAIDLTVVPGARALSMDDLALSGAPIDLTVVPGAVTALMDDLALTGTPIDLTVAQSVFMAALALLATTPDVSIAVAATEIAMAALEHILAANALTVAPGAVAIEADTLALLADAVALIVSVIGSDETIIMAALAAAFGIEPLLVEPGEYVTEMQVLAPSLGLMPLTVFMLLGCALAADRARYGAIVNDTLRYYATVSDRTGCK